jgi:hypothetical protein
MELRKEALIDLMTISSMGVRHQFYISTEKVKNFIEGRAKGKSITGAYTLEELVSCEAYQLMRDGLGMSADEMHEVFAEWNEGELDSYTTLFFTFFSRFRKFFHVFANFSRFRKFPLDFPYFLCYSI